MRSYHDYVTGARRRHGDKFSDVSLDQRFVPYFENGQRIKVESCGETATGTIGVTTGWQPCFLLMRRRTSIGSSFTLGPRDKIVAVQRNGRYVPVPS